MVHVTLPVPPSVNRIWRRAKQGGMYKVPEAVAYVWRALACFKAAGLRTTGDDPRFPRGDVAVVAVWHRKGQQGDLDNRLKLLLDAGTGVLWTDDKQVADIRIVRRAAEGVPRIELWVMPADAAPALTTEPRVA